MTRSLLTQSEAAFLLAPVTNTAGDCIRAAMLSLISQGRIAVAEKSRLFASPSFELILGSDRGPDGLASHQRAVEMALREYRDGKRLSSTDVPAALQKRFGYQCGRYVHDYIAPELIAMGYIVRVDSKWLGLIPRFRFELTARGRSVVELLKRELSSLDDLPKLVKTNPAYALQLAHSAGVMLVLSPVARRQIPRLRQMMAQRGDDSAPIMLAGTDTSSSVAGFESHAWSADFAGCAFLDGASAVCDATASDGGMSDGGSDGGGDGGGGD